MKNILIICSEYGEKYDANGICVKNIAYELMKQGNKVYIIAEGKKDKKKPDIIDGIEVYYIKYRNFSELVSKSNNMFFLTFWKILLFIRRFCVFMFYPNVSFIRYIKVLKLSRKIISSNGISIVIGAYRPFESLATIVKLKKRYKDKIKAVSYHLDLLLEPNTVNSIIRTYKIKCGNKFMQKELKYVDMVLLPESAQCKFNSSKIKYMDFPLFLENQEFVKYDYSFSNDYFNIVYIGTIDGKNRNLDYINKVIKKMSSIYEKKIILHIWGNVDEGSIQKIIKNNDNIKYHGYIDNKYTFSILNKADCLLNLSNIITYKMVPSKIFQLFSIGKPILNIVYNNEDASIPYFEKSGISLNVYAFNTITKDEIKKIVRFLDKKNRLTLKRDEFVKSSPSYTVNIMLNSNEKKGDINDKK